MVLDHYLPHLFGNFNQFSVYTHNTVFQWAVQSTEHSDFALWHNYATWTDETRIFQINTLFNFFVFDFFYVFQTFLSMNPRGSKHAEDIKNWKKWIKVLIWKECISLVHAAKEYSDIMAKEIRLPPVCSLSAYCLMIVIRAKKVHVPQIWP